MEWTVFTGISGIVLSVLSYFAGAKKQSNEDVGKRAYFEGEIHAKLDQLINSFEKLEAKLSKNTDDLYAAIHNEIKEHEKRYHNE